MKLIHMITDIDLTENSAQPIHIFSLAKYLARCDLKVRLIYPFWHENEVRLPSGVIGVPINVPQLPYLRSRIFQLKLLLLLNRLPKPDILYIRLSAGMIAPLIWTYIAGVSLFVEINGIIMLEYIMVEKRVAKIKQWLKLQRIHLVEKLNLEKAAGIVFVTNELRRYYTQRYGLPQNNAITIHNGVDLELFQPIDKNQARRQLELKIEEPALVFVGSLAPWQGLDDAIRAIKILAERGISCRLYIVGDGGETPRLQAIAREVGVLQRIIFIGTVDQSFVPWYISALDICLIPIAPKRNLLSGVSPLKLYEYMACARPIVATDIPGLEVVTEVGAGVNAKAGSPESLADAVEQMIERQREWEDMGMQGRSYVETHASWQHVAERTVAFFKNQLEGTR